MSRASSGVSIFLADLASACHLRAGSPERASFIWNPRTFIKNTKTASLVSDIERYSTLTIFKNLSYNMRHPET
jgi:hypothetical protein